MPVRTEGCDCLGYVWSLVADEGDVTLCRSGGTSTTRTHTPEDVVAAMLERDPGALNDTRTDLLEDR